MVRRVVTGLDGSGKPVVVSDGEPPRSRKYAHTPGFANSVIWATALPVNPGVDTTTDLASLVPSPGATVAMTVTFPPDAVFAAPGFDFAAAGAEQLEASPGLAELFEPDAPGMHTTPTIDYGIVIEGQLVLDLDNGETAVLNQGDVIVQNATRHAWRNPGTTPATLFVVLVGAER
jgi:mannose-6-phosphate isomerase-like protein (cupin superfamily)